jgi:hypothetical protein
MRGQCTVAKMYSFFKNLGGLVLLILTGQVQENEAQIRTSHPLPGIHLV